MKTVYHSIEQEIERQEKILLQTVGTSMEPLLHERKSSVVIEKPPEKLKKYDVVLFRRPTGEYVLHRVWKVRRKDYLICGDNGIWREPVSREQILGIMTGFYPDESGCFVSCGDEEYRRYLRTLGRRYCIRWIRALPGRIYRKIMR